MSEKVYFPGQIKNEYRGNRTIVLIRNLNASDSCDVENVGTFDYGLLDILRYIATGENSPTNPGVSLAEDRSLDEMPVFGDKFFYLTGEGRKHFPVERVYMGVNDPTANEVMSKRAHLCDGSVTFEDLDQLLIKKEFL